MNIFKWFLEKPKPYNNKYNWPVSIDKNRKRYILDPRNRMCKSKNLALIPFVMWKY